MGQHLASELAHGSTAETGRQTRLRDKRLQCSTLDIVIGKEEHWEPFPFAFLAVGWHSVRFDEPKKIPFSLICVSSENLCPAGGIRAQYLHRFPSELNEYGWKSMSVSKTVAVDRRQQV